MFAHSACGEAGVNSPPCQVRYRKMFIEHYIDKNQNQCPSIPPHMPSIVHMRRLYSIISLGRFQADAASVAVQKLINKIEFSYLSCSGDADTGHRIQTDKPHM